MSADCDSAGLPAAFKRVEDVKLRPDRQGHPDWTVPDMLSPRAFLSGSAWHKGGPPVASGMVVAVNVMMTARLQPELRGGPDGPKQYCPPRDVARHPIEKIRHIFHTTA
jgi:hypothetical protein